MAAPFLLMKAGEPTPLASQFPDLLALYACLRDGTTHTFHTSGTTGNPKPITFTAAQILWSAQLSIEALSLSQGYIGLLAMPLQFVAGKMMMARAFVAKADLWYVSPSLRPFEAKLPALDFVALTPAQVQTTLMFPEDMAKLKQVKVLLMGGGVVSSEAESILQQFPHQVFHSYGMTETLTHCALRNIAPCKEAAFRLHHPSISFKVDDGILSINYPFLTQGFLQTNDVVNVDKDGFVFVGRKDEVINLGGLKLYPSELEASLPQNIFKGCAWFIAGKPHRDWGQVPWLWVEGLDDVDIEMLVSYLSGKRKLYGCSFMSEFKRTTSGKIQKKATTETPAIKEKSFV